MHFLTIANIRLDGLARSPKLWDRALTKFVISSFSSSRRLGESVHGLLAAQKKFGFNRLDLKSAWSYIWK